MVRQPVLPESLPDPSVASYNHAIIDDGVLYISGQVAADKNWNVVGDDIETQTRQAYRNIEAILNEVDKEFSDVVKIRSYLVNINQDRQGYDKVWNEVFEEPPYPCHILLGVDQLASEEYLVEVEAEVSI